MTSIAAASSTVTQVSTVARAVAATATAGVASAAPSTPPPPPAAVISISPGTLSANSYPGDKTAEQRVNSLVEAVKTHNDIADLLIHVDWEGIAKDLGEDRVSAYRNEAYKYLDYSSARLGREFGESGIDIRQATDKQVADTGVARGTLMVRDFTFNSGGSVYAVTAREDGTLVGTRDGEAWKSWKTLPKQAAPASTTVDAATTALATLQGMISSAASETAAGGLSRLLELTV